MDEWRAEGERLFGPDARHWKFKCVRCGHVQTWQDFKEAGLADAENYMYYSCLGRWVKGRGCDWTLGGLFRIHTQEVITEDGHTIPTFEFANL